MRSSPRLGNTDQKPRQERAQGAKTTGEDLIVDLFFDVVWCSDRIVHHDEAEAVLPGAHICPILSKTTSLRVVLQLVALDHNDPDQFPNLAYLGLESLGRADLSLSLKLFVFLDLFSILPLGTLLAQDFLLDLVYDLLGPRTGC